MASHHDDRPVEHSKPLSASRTAQWAKMKASGDGRVQRVIDRMTPIINLEPPPKGAKKLQETARLSVQPDYPAGYSPDYTIKNPWLVFSITIPNTRDNKHHKNRLSPMTKGFEWKSARDSAWRKKHWGVRTGTPQAKQKDGRPRVPAEIIGDKAIDRFFSVLSSTLSYYSHINAPDPEFKKGWVRSLLPSRLQELTCSLGYKSLSLLPSRLYDSNLKGKQINTITTPQQEESHTPGSLGF